MAIPNAPERVSGRVEAVNPKGCRIDGQWWNYSRFADDIVPPERGQLVILLLDKSGFVRTVAPLDSSEVTPTRNGAQNATSGQQRDRTITRLAVLKAAAEYAASKPDSKSRDVLAIAASWEQWILRPDDADDIEEAF